MPGIQPPPSYALPFGPGPYLPSEAKSDFQGFLRPEDFPSAAYCGHCHEEVHDQWRQSAHANSFRSPWYLKNVHLLTDAKGLAYSRHCEGCHNPAGMFTGAIDDKATVARPNDDDGITCMVCHSIQQIQSTSGTGSYVMGRPAVMVDADGQPVAGLPSDKQILDHLDWHRKAVMQPFYRTAEYCSVCHKAAIPKMLNGYKWLRSFNTFDEWQQSSWSRETPMPFYTKPEQFTCQDCHMPVEPAVSKAYAGRGIASHRWLGANTAVPTYFHYPEQVERVEAFLKEDKVDIDIFALTVEHSANSASGPFKPTTLIAPLGSVPFSVMAGDFIRVDVVVRNKQIGHGLVPELRDFYECWLDFDATDSEGHSIYRSGALNDKHRVDRSARAYTQTILTRRGTVVDHHDIWNAYIKAYDATVLPGRSDLVRYRFRIPEGLTGAHLSVALRYRRFNRTFTDWALDNKPEDPDPFPTVTMATASFDFKTGMNAPNSPDSPAVAVEKIRWNNYGIGMIDRQMFAEAFNAFEQVVKLDPKYEPGYVNMAVADYMRGRYNDALKWIALSAKLDAADPRAQYYKGLCLRWQKHYEEAIATLEPVAAKYPRFRQVHQELGYIYLILHKYSDSKAHYEAVLAIDPDDPTAHRWIGADYAALGDRANANKEAILAAQTNNDTSAGWVLQRYWRENPDVARKSMPAHTYSPGDAFDDANVQRVLDLQNPPSFIWIEHE
jgi:tetratricopeptide (TPR) repeat protein